MKINILLGAYRHYQRLTTVQIAKELGLSKATYNRIERGHMPSAEALIKILFWLFAPPPREEVIGQR